MIKNVNPRVGMYQALYLAPELLASDKHYLIQLFLDIRYKKPIKVIRMPLFDRPTHEVVDGVSFEYLRKQFSVPIGSWLVKDRKTEMVTALDVQEYERLYTVYPDPAAAEIDKLAHYIENYFPSEISKRYEHEGKEIAAESAAEVAIMLLRRLKALDAPLANKYREGVYTFTPQENKQAAPGPEAVSSLFDQLGQETPPGEIAFKATQPPPVNVTLRPVFANEADGSISFKKLSEPVIMKLFSQKTGGLLFETFITPEDIDSITYIRDKDGTKLVLSPEQSVCPSCDCIVSLKHPCACSDEARRKAAIVPKDWLANMVGYKESNPTKNTWVDPKGVPYFTDDMTGRGHCNTCGMFLDNCICAEP